MTAEELQLALKTVKPTAEIAIYVPGRGHYPLSNDVILNYKSQGFSRDYIVLKVGNVTSNA